jgi:hypothetical protein
LSHTISADSSSLITAGTFRIQNLKPDIMFVNVTEPSVVPKFVWGLQKVEHGAVVGSSPTVQAHGQLKQLDDGLELDGKDSWLDAGDFKGTLNYT